MEVIANTALRQLVEAAITAGVLEAPADRQQKFVCCGPSLPGRIDIIAKLSSNDSIVSWRNNLMISMLHQMAMLTQLHSFELLAAPEVLVLVNAQIPDGLTFKYTPDSCLRRGPRCSGATTDSSARNRCECI